MFELSSIKQWTRSVCASGSGVDALRIAWSGPVICARLHAPKRRGERGAPRSYDSDLFFVTARLLEDAHADTITVTGLLTGVEIGVANEFRRGEAFTFTFEYSPTALDFNPDPTRGDYRQAIGTSRAQIGNYEVTGSGGKILVDDGFGSGVLMRVTHRLPSEHHIPGKTP